MVRASLRLASKQHHAAVVSTFEAVCTVPTEQAAGHALLSQRYPAVVRTWQAARSEFTPYQAFPLEMRKVVYPTNLIESINARLRKTTRNRGHFPSEQAALKVLCLAVRELITPEARDVNHIAAAHWKTALNQFSLFFEDQLNAR
nr:transposase [Streptomyces lavenduligriseus]